MLLNALFYIFFFKNSRCKVRAIEVLQASIEDFSSQATLNFDAYIQYASYEGTVQALASLHNKVMVMRTASRTLYAAFTVTLDTVGSMSDVGIFKRRQSEILRERRRLDAIAALQRAEEQRKEDEKQRQRQRLQDEAKALATAMRIEAERVAKQQIAEQLRFFQEQEWIMAEKIRLAEEAVLSLYICNLPP